MKRMKNIWIITLLGLFVYSCTSPKRTDDNTALYPSADAVYINLEKEYVLNTDGTIDYNYKHRLKYLTHASFHRMFGETFVVYNPMFQKLVVNESKTTMADGKEVVAPKNAFNEVLPRFAENTATYNHLREMVMTHTGLECDAIVDLDYSLKSSDDYLPFLSGMEFFNESAPIKNFTLTVKIPVDEELSYSVVFDSIAPVITTDEEWKKYTWNIKNIDAFKYEQEAAIHASRIYFSTTSNFDSVRSFLTSQESYDLTLNDEITDKMKSIVKNDKDVYSIANKLQKYVVNDIKTLHVPLSNAAFRYRSPVEIYNSNNGTEFEKTLLLTAILKSFEVEAAPVIINNKKLFDNSIGTFCFVNDFYVQVVPEDENENFPYFSATSINDPYDLNFKDKSVISLEQNSKTIENKIAKSTIVANAEVKLKNNNISGKVNATFTNAFSSYNNLKKNESSGKQLFSGAKSCKTESSEKTESKLIFEISQDGLEKDHESYLFWNVPMAKKGVESWHLHLMQNRISPIELPNLLSEKYEYSVLLPKNYSLATVPSKVQKENSIGSVITEIRTTEEGFVVIRSIDFSKSKILPSEYKELRDLLLIWRDRKFREVVIRKEG